MLPKPEPSPSGANVDIQRRRLQETFRRGNQLFSEKNFDYAHELFSQCVIKDPNNVPVLEAMLTNLLAKFGAKKRLVAWLGLTSNRAIKKAIGKNDWQEALRIGIEQLKVNPWHVPTLRALAEVCAARHHNETELVYLKQALDTVPRDAEVNRHCARSLARMGQFDQAIACWHRVEVISGRDAEAAQMISRLAEEKLKYPGGRPSILPDIQAPVADAKLKTAEPENLVLTPRQKLEQAIARDSQNLENYFALVADLLNSNQFSTAESLLNRAITVCGKHPEVLQELNRVQSLRAQYQQELNRVQTIERNGDTEAIAIPWIELSLGIGCALLVFQLVPSARNFLFRVANLRQWSQLSWLLLNVIFVLGLIGIHYRSAIGAVVPRRTRRRRKMAE